MEKMVNKVLQQLEDESVYIIRETVAEFANPVLLYSVGKDSTVLLHLLMKAFYPNKPPIKLVHVNTGWKFKEMIEFRDAQVKKYGLDLISYTNPRGDAEDITPFSEGSKIYTDVMKTEALKQVLDMNKFDAAIGGARRDEEKSRAKERIFSARNKFHHWDPKNQRPELWNIFNCQIKQGESMRVFPISNWTEFDVWDYIEENKIDVVPLYFAKKRPVVERDGVKFMVDDDRFNLQPNEEIKQEMVRFRTLGCYPLTGAVASEATTLPEIIKEMRENKFSERQGRLIDSDQKAAMEKKKRQGYF
jgi:sulfate adenylyltransferase subunit 2